MSTTCLVCCEESEVWVLPPCNHKHICWKCCLKLVEGTTFSCPFCKHRPENKSQLLFVTTEEMDQTDFETIMKGNPFRSFKSSLYFYSNQNVAKYIEGETSFHCVNCGEIHENINLLKKHMSNSHKLQFCDVCLDHRRCITAEQRLYSDFDIQKHLKEGELSQTGQIVLYHPCCQFCNRRFYDLDAFKMHLKMSTHLKCQICQINCPNLKYIFYRNYEELEQHHRKTHFVCTIGDCINRKLENVFASEMLLEDHKRKYHRKHKPDKIEREKGDNILLGFNKKEEEDFIEYDGIGKDFSREFNIFEVQDSVQREEHFDEMIDPRQFYPEQVKMTRMTRVDEAVHKLQELHEQYGIKDRNPEFSQVPIYRPLMMTTLSRQQCQKLARRCNSPRQVDSLMDIFFNKRFDFKSPNQWFTAIERKLRSWSHYSFYVIFPQLIRNLRETNKAKPLMDQFYCEKLQNLPVGRKFIFHELKYYSQLIEFTKRQTEEEILKRIEGSQINLEIYAQFLKEMNTNFYLQKQEEIYWVSKEKMTHLYHMVEHCRTQDFLKMNWLLKVGLSVPAYELLKKFYYLTHTEMPQRPFQNLTLQQLSLLKAYLTICLQSVLDHLIFETQKKNPRSHYLTNAINQLSKEPKNLTRRQIEEIRALEGHSDAISHKSSLRRVKGIIIDQSDCPSLLAPIDITKKEEKRSIQQQIQSMLLSGRTIPSQWNEESAKVKKKLPLQGNQEEEFPILGGPSQKQKSNKIKVQQKDQDFPVFSFNDKYIAKKPNIQSQEQKNLDNLIGFNKRSVTRSYWDEDNTRKKMEFEAEAEKERIQEIERNFLAKNQKKHKNKTASTKDITPEPSKNYYGGRDEDSYLREAIEQSIITAKIEEQRRAIEYKFQRTQRTLSRKENPVNKEEDSGQKNQKKRKPKPQKDPEPVKAQEPPKVAKEEPKTLFQRIEQEEKETKREREHFRRDISQQKESEVKERKKQQSKKNVPPAFKAPVIDDDDFAPLVSSNTQKESIITKIMKQSQAQFEEKPQPIKKHKGKRRKNRGDESP